MSPISTCPLCERTSQDLQLTDHHLRTRRTDKDETAAICEACHRQIHALFSNTELRDSRLGLDSVEGLLENEAVQKALGFIRKLKPWQNLPVKESRGRKGR